MGDKPRVVCGQQCPEHLRANRSALAQWCGRSVLKLFGWRVEGRIPNVERLLIIGAPHTSNWDFVYAMATILGLNIRLRWLAKHTIFKPGVRWFMEWLGGIPINRSKPQDVVVCSRCELCERRVCVRWLRASLLGERIVLG